MKLRNVESSELTHLKYDRRGDRWVKCASYTSVFSCYTNFVLKNVTITIPEDVAHWARTKAAEENTSVSRLVGKMLEAQMRQSDDYVSAYRRWKELPALDVDAANRMTRETAHVRR